MRTTVLLVILLHGFVASAGEVVVEEPVTRIVPTRDHLRAWCRTTGPYDACTTFFGFRLDGTCAPEGASWTIRASASFRPWILLVNLQKLPHEMEHIEDMRRSARRFLGELETLRFRTEEDCRAKVIDESGHFGETMRAFALQSNLRHHPQLGPPTKQRVRRIAS